MLLNCNCNHVNITIFFFFNRDTVVLFVHVVNFDRYRTVLQEAKKNCKLIPVSTFYCTKYYIVNKKKQLFYFHSSWSRPGRAKRATLSTCIL